MSCETRRRHVSEASARPTASRNGAPACRRGEDRGAWQCSSIAKRPTDEIPSAFATQDPTFPGYAVLHFTFLRAEVVKVPRLVAPTGESKLSSTSHGQKRRSRKSAELSGQAMHQSRDAHASRGTSTPMRGLGGRLQAGAPFLDAVERAWASASRRRLVPQNFEQAAQRYAQLRRVSQYCSARAADLEP